MIHRVVPNRSTASTIHLHRVRNAHFSDRAIRSLATLPRFALQYIFGLVQYCFYLYFHASFAPSSSQKQGSKLTVFFIFSSSGPRNGCSISGWSSSVFCESFSILRSSSSLSCSDSSSATLCCVSWRVWSWFLATTFSSLR